MLRLVEFPLADGGAVTVAVVDRGPRTASDEVTRGLRREQGVVERSKLTFDTAVDMVRPVADALLRRLRDLHQVPDEVTVEFGVELGAEAGAFIATASTAAQFKIAMTWRSGGSREGG